MPSKVRLLDGSMSQQLEEFGYDTAKNSPHWSFPANQDSDLMRKVYNSFLDIGVDVMTTNTYHFGSTLDKTIPENIEKKEIYQKYFENACSLLSSSIIARNLGKVQIFGSVGTLATLYHNMSEYTGEYMNLPEADKTAMEYFETILRLFQDRTEIRNLIFETIPSAREAEAALKVLKKFPEMTAIFSFTFKESAILRSGESISEIASHLKNCDQILGIGINCTSPENVLPVLKEIQKYKFQEIFVYPNMGDAKFFEKRKDEDEVFEKEMISEWIHMGATAIGGCCGITGKQMETLRKILDEFNNL